MQFILQHERKIFWITCAIACLALLVKALEVALYIPTYHLDGAFQTASGLFRMSEAQWPGKDFYTYLGTGLLLLLYPVFFLLGEDLSASIVSAHFFVYLALFLSVFIVIRLARIEVNRNWALLIAVGVVGLLFLSSYELHVLRERFGPGNSLRPLRAFLPYLAFFALFYVLGSTWHRNYKLIAVSLLAASCFLWSNDFALPTAFLVGIFGIGWLAVNRQLNLTNLTILAVFFFGGVYVVLTVSTWGHAKEVLAYNFVDVRKDQYWYFAPWFSSSRIFSVVDLKEKLLPDYGWQIYLLPGFFFVACVTKKLEHFCFVFIGLAAFLGGAVATVGGHRGGYQNAYLYWSLIASGAFLWGMATVWIFVLFGKFKRHVPFVLGCSGKSALTLTPLLAATFVFVSNQQEFNAAEELAQNDGSVFYSEDLGGYIGVEWQDYLALAKGDAGNESVLEEYWGIWGAVTRTFAPKTDAVIHALGSVRTQFFDNPDVVISTRASVSHWQQWGFSANYWFYSRLLREYYVDGFSPTTIIWRRSKEARQASYSQCKVDRDNSHISLDVDEKGYYELELIVDTSLVPSRGLVLVKNNINYAWGAAGHLSLDTDKVKHVFPVKLNKAGGHQLPLRLIHGNHENRPPKDMLLGCRLASIPRMLTDVAKPMHIQGEPYPLSDKNWQAGVATFAPAVLVANTPENREAYKSGAVISFSNGEQKKIKRTVTSKKYINLYFTGDRLDPNVHGFPRRFTLMANESLAQE